jgi:glutathione S-transferase
MIDVAHPLTIVGMPGSPYSRKLRAVLRYRRIPHVWVHQHSPEARGVPAPRVELLPRLVLPSADGTLAARTDSTPLIRELETLHPGRSVIPLDPVVAFLDALLEDYADEWLTKPMFHFRWACAADVAQAAAILPRWARTSGSEDDARALGAVVAERQIGRLGVVGSNPVTAPVIEDSYRRLSRAARYAAHGIPLRPGARPGAADRFYGQLTQLAGFDPTPRAIALATAPRIVAWVDVVDDLSGVAPGDADWLTRDAVPASVRALLAEVGRVYVPFLLANAAALERGADRVECTIDGRPWVQRPFPYQGKCLTALRQGYATLAPGDRQEVRAILSGTGCEALLAP